MKLAISQKLVDHRLRYVLDLLNHDGIVLSDDLYKIVTYVQSSIFGPDVKGT